MIALLYFLTEAIFEGALTLSFILIIVNVLKIKFHFNHTVLIEAINLTLLASGCIHFLFLFWTFFADYFSGAEYVRYTYTNRWFGSYWWATWIILFVWTFVPQVLWFPKPRRSMIWLTVVIAAQFLFRLMLFIIQWEIAFARGGESTWAMLPTFSFVNYLEHLGTYLMIVSVLYYGLSKRKQAALA